VEYTLSHPAQSAKWHATSQTVVLLTCPDEKWLSLHAENLELEGVPVAWFREPDLNNSLTAVACVYGGRALSKLPLLGGGEDNGG
jgi:hypothetical protein